MNRATDLEIMERLQSKAASCGTHLTYTQMLFFLRLVTYADSQEDSICPEGLCVSLSVNELVSTLHVTKRMVSQSLRILSDCGILLRHKGEKNSFPPVPSTTILRKEFYERSETE